MKKHIVVLAGDGIGREVTQWGVNILKGIGEKYGHEFTFEDALIGHSAIEATGNPLPEATVTACKGADAVLLGAVGHPMYDNNPNLKVRPEQGLLAIRKALGLYTNIRPIKIFDDLIAASSIKPEILSGADIMFFRELTGGIYFGSPREILNDGKTHLDTMIYHEYEVERIGRRAYEAARQRGKKLCSVDKANVLESSRLWRKTMQRLAAEYTDVETTHMFVDNAAMQLIRDPRQFDVVVTGNLFGDILTDEASQISGSLGMLPSAAIGDDVGLFEPVHGSAPDIAGKGIANPMATIQSVALMLEIAFGLKKEADAVIGAIDKALAEGYRTGDIADKSTPKDKILGTDAIGLKLLEYI